MKISIFKSNIKSFISNFSTENYEVNNENNDVVHISKNKKLLLNEEEQLILDVCTVSKFILCNNVGEETNYLLTYDNGWPESIPNLFITEYYIKFGMLKFPMHLLVV